MPTSTRFLGNSAPDNPQVEPLLDAARTLHDDGVVGERGVLSARYGNRCTVSPAGTPITRLASGSFLEVVEYDPHGDQLLILGGSEPDPQAAVHALVYRARDEVKAILQFDVPPDHPVHDVLPRAEGKGTPLDDAMGVLEGLRDHDAVSIAARWVLAVGGTPAEAEAVLRGALAGTS